ncbi:Neural cell adhesion molecule 2 [Halotydeus destructor]|nr:Neural cell adhesion molecule 2 [Halotydeus destructor]
MKLPVLSYLVKFAIVFLCTVQRAHRTEAGKAGAPLEPDNSLPMKTVAIEGASAMLPCRFTTPSRDAVRLIFWYKGANATGQPLYIVDARNKSLVTATHFPGDFVGRMSFDVSSSALRIHSVLAEDHGLHYCRVDFRRSRTVVSALMLDVVVPPRKILLLDEFSQIMSTTIGPFDEASSLYVVCESEGGIPAPQLTWYLDSEVIKNDTSSVIGNKVVRTWLNMTLTRNHYNKTLTCKAHNSYFSISKSVAVDMNHAPICKTAQKIFYGVASGESVQVSCEVNANPRNVSFVWSMGNRTLPSANDDVIGTKSYIKLSPHSLQDYGTVSCRAANAIGSQVEPCLFTILPAGPPEPLQGCTLANSTSLLFHVSCIPGYDGGLPQSIHLDVYESTSDKSLEVFTQLNDANFTLRQLTPNRTYIIHVYSSNAKGRSSSLVLPLTTAPVRVSKGRPYLDFERMTAFLC